MPVTLSEIAKEANVSKTIVSRVLNNRPGVSESTRKRVLEIIEKKNYRVNRLAQSLSNKKTGVIGVIVTNLCSIHLFKMIEGIEEVCLENDYHVMFCNGNKKSEIKNKYIEFFYSGHADGVLIYGSSMNDDELIKDLHKTDFPFVLIENNIDDIDANSILIDNFEGSAKAARKAIEAGHKNIAYIQGSPKDKAAVQRYKGFLESMKKASLAIPEGYVKSSESFSEKSGYNAAGELMKMNQRPTCIMCASDTQAYGVIKWCSEHEVNIPDDVSVIGFDYDKSYAMAKYPELTTVEQPMDAIGKESAKLLIDKVNGKNDTNKKIIIPTRWIKGETLKIIK